MNKLIECKTQEELEKCCKHGDIAIVRQGIFTACDSSQVTACNSSQVRAYDSSQVRACDSSQVTACDSSQVTAYDSSQVRAYGSSQVTAYSSSQVRAYGSSQVRACDSSQVTAYGSSQVRAYGSSQVRAYGSSQVTACDSSQVTAYGYVAITRHGQQSVKASKSCHVIDVTPVSDIDDYCGRFPLDQTKAFVWLFKAVSPQRQSLCSTTPITYPDMGVVKCDKLDPPSKGSCAQGLHFAHFDWAVTFGQNYKEFIILKAKIRKDHIVVSPDCDGKIRTDEAEIVEVITDWQHYNPFEGK